MEELKFPNYVKIGNYAFSNCVSLKNIYFKKRPLGEEVNSNRSNTTVCGEYAFKDCTSLSGIYGSINWYSNFLYNVPRVTIYSDSKTFYDAKNVENREKYIKNLKNNNAGVIFEPYDYSNYVYPYTGDLAQPAQTQTFVPNSYGANVVDFKYYVVPSMIELLPDKETDVECNEPRGDLDFDEYKQNSKIMAFDLPMGYGKSYVFDESGTFIGYEPGTYTIGIYGTYPSGEGYQFSMTYHVTR